VEIEDDWNKGEEDDNWDPDFDEFDLPKSKGKKAGVAKKPSKADDDFGVDDDFKDLGLFDDMNDGGGFDDDDF
jgi:DNA-directed RNA polymerase subunit delta